MRFGVRPLGDEAFYPLWLVDSPAGDVTNLSLVHEHVVYMNENGELRNIGFLGEELGVDAEPNFDVRVPDYHWGPIQGVDLTQIDLHSLDFQASN